MAMQRNQLRQLGRDNRGNTLMIVAAMFVPLMAFVGSGIDVGRAYMAKSRLQAACDAGVLAARKVSVGTLLTTEGKNAGGEYFNANYGKNSFSSYDVNFSLSQEGPEIAANARAKLNTSIMRIFGTEYFDLSVDCSALQEIADTDVLFVLDTTGSMLQTNPGDSMNRFEAMKSAVTEFHHQIEGVRPAGSKMRYGFLPYTSTVNVGYLLQSDWMVPRATYQSRRVHSNETNATTNTRHENYQHVSGSIETVEHSTYPATLQGGSEGVAGSYTCMSMPASTASHAYEVLGTRSEPFPGPPAGTRTITEYRNTITGTAYSLSRVDQVCTVTATTYHNYVQTYDQVVEPYSLTQLYWEYAPIEYDVSSLRGRTSGGEIIAPINPNGDDRKVAWQGCIEERKTVSAASYDPLPSGALDLDLDLVPENGNPDTQWRPALPGLVYMRPTVAPIITPAGYNNLADFWVTQTFCPPKAQKLQPLDDAQLQTYLDTLYAGGGTQHDIGVAWGARMLSPRGIWAAENQGGQARHMIFMTDGAIEVGVNEYDAYGHPFLDRRRQEDPGVDPTQPMLNKVVEDRFLALCKATRQRGITIWMVAFGTSMTPAMEQCSGSGKAFQANNAAELHKAFKEIAGKIARLRLTN